MNKRIAILAACLAAVALSAGCASSSTVQRLEAQNRELTKRISQMQKQVYAAQHRTEVRTPAPMPTAPMAPPPAAMINPSLARQMSGTPQNWGYLNRPSEMCDRTALSFRFENWSGQYLALMLDGQPVQIIGESTTLPHQPPNTSVYICLTRLGHHTLQGVGFIGRPPQLVRSGRFTKRLHITPSRLGHFEHIYAEDIR